MSDGSAREVDALKGNDPGRVLRILVEPLEVLHALVLEENLFSV